MKRSLLVVSPIFPTLAENWPIFHRTTLPIFSVLVSRYAVFLFGTFKRFAYLPVSVQIEFSDWTLQMINFTDFITLFFKILLLKFP